MLGATKFPHCSRFPHLFLSLKAYGQDIILFFLWVVKNPIFCNLSILDGFNCAILSLHISVQFSIISFFLHIT